MLLTIILRAEVLKLHMMDRVLVILLHMLRLVHI
nr:MAG TPA: hypothetical protein [Caudoviricetes sp.]